MRSGFRNDYAYALVIREWVDSKGRTWFSGFALRSNEPYKNEGAASFGVVIGRFARQFNTFGSYVDWYKRVNVLADDVWVDVTRQKVKHKRELV